MKPSEWVGSNDAKIIKSAANGQVRGDGYDVAIYQSRRTGRYLVSAYNVAAGRSSWYVADCLDGAEAVGRAGYTPGSGPGAYDAVSRFGALKEARAV